MKYSSGICLRLVLLIAIVAIAYGAPKMYNFVPAKCEVHDTDKSIGGPLRICTFPPRYAQVPQQDIDAVIDHIQTLNL